MYLLFIAQLLGEEGINVLALSLNVVIAYEHDDYTNTRQRRGCQVITIPEAELDEDVVVVIACRAHYCGIRP